MKEFKEKILKDGIALNEEVLKVDSFVNHGVDPELMQKIGKHFADKYKDKGITKVITIESSGISPSIFTALYLGVDLIVLRKSPTRVLSDNIIQTTIVSFTKGVEFQLTMNKDYITKDDKVLIIDDFLAKGEAATGAIRLIERQGAKVVAIGILIEKSFQQGSQMLKDLGYEVYSLARIKRLKQGSIEFEE